ncbi:MAG TPA: gfo/Idh/MocA family oxidoreductase [Lacipirellulaceae bacterium]|jgi:predicted dehydrogenase|nr:gfo/Idh/MocA family oxidoreductase [Lacipirellulaceae bacterium]
MFFSRLWFIAVAVVIVRGNILQAADQPIRVGIIGCDTSHVKEFTKLINDPKATGDLEGVKITTAYPGGTDVPASKNRIDGFVKNLRDQGVKIVDSLEKLSSETDAILLESVDGRPHLEQFRAVAKGKPVFIDKPTAASLADIISIFRIADETHTPVFSSSSLRFCKEVEDAATNKSIGEMLGCETSGPFSTLPHHPDLFFYGIHGVEPLFTIMGTGCESVSRTDSPLSTVVVGKWKDGRLGSYRGIKKGHNYSICTFGSEGVVQHTTKTPGYEKLVSEICKFFKTQEPPVGRDQTIEIYAFMEAADESKRQDGKDILLSDTIHRAEEKSAADVKAKP